MQSMITPSCLEPNIEFLFNDAGETLAACVTGFVGYFWPERNRAVCERPAFLPRRAHRANFWPER